jgi:hypothetical protein
VPHREHDALDVRAIGDPAQLKAQSDAFVEGSASDEDRLRAITSSWRISVALTALSHECHLASSSSAVTASVT